MYQLNYDIFGVLEVLSPRHCTCIKTPQNTFLQVNTVNFKAST